MKLRTLLAAAALTMTSMVSANAATFPTFEIDTGASTINVTEGSGCIFPISCASLDGSFGSGATGFSWTPGSATDSIHVNDFFNWTPSGIGFESFNVVVNLVFSSPSAGSSTGNGSGGFSTLFGSFTDGSLTWSSVSSALFSDGSTLDISFDNTDIGDSTSSGATFTGNTVAMAPVPLPASIPLLAGGLIALGALKRRRRKAA